LFQVVPDEGNDRCKVVIEGCQLNFLYRVQVSAMPEGVYAGNEEQMYCCKTAQTQTFNIRLYKCPCCMANIVIFAMVYSK